MLTFSVVSLIWKILCVHLSTPPTILNSPLVKFNLLLTASTNTVESSPTIVPLKLPTMLSAVMLGALMAPVNVPEPALTAFEVALKKLELSVALTSPLKVPEALMAPVALFKITVLSSPIILALTEPALISSVTCTVPKYPAPQRNTLEPTFLALSTSGSKCDSILVFYFRFFKS